MAKHRGKTFKVFKRVWLVLSVLWLAWIGSKTLGQWPAAPLDSGYDAATREALNGAVMRHVLTAAVLGFGVPLAAYALGRLLLPKAASGTDPAVDTASGPRRVLLLRHAEKTGDPDDIHLSADGVRRAERLASYIPQTFGGPDFIFAAARSKRSIRSIETMQPLAAATGKPVQHDVEDDDFEDLIRRLFSEPQYRDATVVVCWHHNKLPAIAAMLGAPRGSFPDPWPQDLFNAIVDIRYGAGAPATARQVIQPF